MYCHAKVVAVLGEVVAQQTAEAWGVLAKIIVRALLSAAVMFCICLLEVSLFAKLLGLFAWLWVVFTVQLFFSTLGDAIKVMREIRTWTRFTFVTTHIRNESDGLEPTYERVLNDVEEERAAKLGGHLETPLAFVAVALELVSTALVLLAMLYVLASQADLRQSVIRWLATIAGALGLL